MHNFRLLALSSICDTFVGSVLRSEDPDAYWRRSATEQGIPERILQLLAGAKAEDQAAFNQLMWLISSPMLGLTWGGPLRPAHRLTPAQREKMLQRWSKSPLLLLRNAFNTLRKATTFLYFGDVPAGEQANPNWATIGYQLPQAGPIHDQSPLPVLVPSEDITLECDILVIGSGSGGGIVAATLAAAGKNVIVVEKGKYTRREAFSRHEFPMMHRHYEAGALLATEDGSVSVLAGSTLGGGSAINWAGALRTPDYVLEEWTKEHQNPDLQTPDFLRGFEEIEARNHVRADFKHNPQNQLLMDGAQQLDWKVENIPMNMRFPEGMPADEAWKAAGFSSIGDAYGIKQNGTETYLRDASNLGARILTETSIETILIQQGKAVGAKGFALRSDGRKVAVTIHAQKTVVSAGALHTPVLLLKSGLQHQQIGQNLFLHPVVPVAGFYDREIIPWHGPMMSVIVQEHTRLTGNFGVRLECPPVHPGLAASALSWESSEQFKSDVFRMRHLAVQICLVRDRFGGRVTVGKQSGQPILKYRLHNFDKAHLIHGLQKSVEVFNANGAKQVTIPHNNPLHFYPNQQKAIAPFQQKIAERNWGSNYMGLYSAHQMGTCRMGGSHAYPVQPNGETREVRNLFVADASLFPSASGANPMHSVQALALWVAKGLV